MEAIVAGPVNGTALDLMTPRPLRISLELGLCVFRHEFLQLHLFCQVRTRKGIHMHTLHAKQSESNQYARRASHQKHAETMLHFFDV